MAAKKTTAQKAWDAFVDALVAEKLIRHADRDYLTVRTDSGVVRGKVANESETFEFKVER